jgi:alcohol dehydrogenase YqhD (iron-dependent ADH family)
MEVINMQNFRFYVPTDIRFGTDRLSELPEALSSVGKRVLLVYGGGSIKKSGLYDKVQEQLVKGGFEVVELSGIEPNPKIQSVRSGVKLIREHQLEVILAVGGGSVIDTAKVIAAGVFYEGDPWDLVVDSSKIKQALPIVDILTLAATGTEMNRNAVISNPDTKEKLGTGGAELIPHVSFLDPTTTFSVSKWQTAAGAADILSHLFEQYFNRTKAVQVQDNIAEALMKVVVDFAPVAFENPDDYDARANLLWASTLALNGLVGNGRSGGWTCHPIEHELSAFYDITHGIGLAILTPRWMDYCITHDPSTHEKFAKYGAAVWGLSGDSQAEIARKAVKSTYEFFEDQLKIPMTLQKVGIETTELVDEMSQQAVVHGELNTEGPFVRLDEKAVKSIITACFEEMSLN